MKSKVTSHFYFQWQHDKDNKEFVTLKSVSTLILVVAEDGGREGRGGREGERGRERERERERERKTLTDILRERERERERERRVRERGRERGGRERERGKEKERYQTRHI